MSASISIETSPLESTGGKVWHAAVSLYDFLKCVPELSRSGLRVLELGSGCGWLGLTLANDRIDLEVVMSEQSMFGALDWLQHNISLNPGVCVNAIELDWSSIPREVSARHWDIIIGSELVYSYIGADLLTSVVSTLLSSSRSVFYYAHSLNRFESVDEFMLKKFKEKGLMVEIVFGEEKLAHEPGSFTELFRDLQLVIFRITKM